MCENNDLFEQTDPEQLTGESADSQVRRPINIVGPEPLLLKFPLADHYRHAYPKISRTWYFLTFRGIVNLTKIRL
jgi:hypothetical protein